MAADYPEVVACGNEALKGGQLVSLRWARIVDDAWGQVKARWAVN